VNEPNAPEQQDAEDLRNLYRAASQPEPPVALGEEIRQAARDSLQVAKPGSAWPWRQGVAVAAVLVLSVSILLLFPREQLRAPGETPVQAPAASDAPRPARPAAPVLETQPEPAVEKKRKASNESRPESSRPAARALLQAPAAESGMESSAAGAAADVQRDPAVGSETMAEEAEQPGVTDDTRGDTDVLDESYYRSSPELWISHIERLLSEGRFADAKSEFDAFKAAHPRHPYAAR
jgi:hypothetical protein